MATAAPNLMEGTDPAVLQEQYRQEAAASAGGPGMEGDPGAPVQTPPAEGTPAAKPIYKTFGREFHTAEDLAEYTKEMERQVVESRLAAERLQKPGQNTNTLNTQQVQVPPKIEGPAVDELLFTDPKKAVSMLRQQARDDVMRELGAKEQEQIFWKGFYERNPDLQNADRIVKSIVKEKWAEIANLPLAESEKILAGETRALVEKIRTPSGTRKELTPTSASSLPASGASAPPIAVAQGEPESFVAQIKKFQRRNRH
jgi:hypothetical protein